MSELFDWFGAHAPITGTLFGVSLVMFVAGILLVPLVLVRMPADYFMRERSPLEGWKRWPHALRIAFLAVKNAAGVVLVVAGVMMLILPGQGVLTILVGITLLNFPGKQGLELWLVRRRPVLGAINWIRGKASRPPLELPSSEQQSKTRADSRGD